MATTGEGRHDGRGCYPGRGPRRRGHPKEPWQQQVKEDMTGVGVTQDVALDDEDAPRRHGDNR